MNLNKYCEYWIKYIVSTFYRRLGFLVVADRHAVDELVEVNNLFYSSRQLLYTSLFPMPNLVVLFKSSSETIHERRPSITVSQAQFYNERYHEAGSNLKAPSIMLCGENKIELNRKFFFDRLFGDFKMKVENIEKFASRQTRLKLILGLNGIFKAYNLHYRGLT